MNVRGPLTRRNAFSILELMIALALLATLMTVAWSILGTYRAAEERGWDQSYRMQVTRVARSWLVSDAAEGLRADALERTDPGAAPAEGFRFGGTPVFRGDERGLQWRQVPSVDPLPWLDDLTSGFQPLESVFEVTDIDNEGPAVLLDPLAVCTVHYRIIREGMTSDETVIDRLQRELRTDDPWDDQRDEEEEAPDEVLSGEDLYRSEDAGTMDDTTGKVVATGAVRYLVGARFRYCDGGEWVSQWDSNLRRALPTAIELSFDFPPASVTYTMDNTETMASTEEVEDLATEPAVVAGEPVLEGVGEEVPERDVRIVVRIFGVASSAADDF